MAAIAIALCALAALATAETAGGPKPNGDLDRAGAAGPLDSFHPPEPDRAVRGGLLGVGSAASLEDCAAACLAKPRCVAVAFAAASSSCSMHAYDSKFTVFESKGSIYLFKIPPRDDQPWKPALHYSLSVPTGGVALQGILKTCMDNNVNYLLTHSVDDMVYFWRNRTGKPNPGKPIGWDPGLHGSVAAEFLMGSGGTLRWFENVELRKRMNSVVQVISECQLPDGFIMAFRPDQLITSENPNYVQSWVTHGLLEAHIAGNTAAFGLLRKHWDWYNYCKYLPLYLPPDEGEVPYWDRYDLKVFHKVYMTFQGMIGHTRMALMPEARARDVHILQELFQEDWWLSGLAARNVSSVYLRSYAHNYELTGIEAYLDLYVLTGETRYLEAVLGAWDLFNNYWIHLGGSLAINEPIGGNISYPPGSYFMSRLYEGPVTGEFCGSMFWLKINQRLHRLYPDEEKYVNEMERVIINIGISAQDLSNGAVGYRYFAHLHGSKDHCSNVGTCCEGQATRLYGSLPEYMYSVDDRPMSPGLYVDMYFPSTFSGIVAGIQLKVACQSQFPYDGSVKLHLTPSSPAIWTLNLRIPRWSAGMVAVSVNGVIVQSGSPGVYVKLTRKWKVNDVVSFILPMALTAHRYSGTVQYGTAERWGYLYGPVLMAAQGPAWSWNVQDCLVVPIHRLRASNPASWLTQSKPLHFNVAEDTRYSLKPYFEVATDERFTVYPIIGEEIDTTCNTGWEAKVGAAAKVTCPNGKLISKVTFASYGQFKGDCFSGLEAGWCHAANSLSVVTKMCVGKNSCIVPATAEPFGDPCPSYYKGLAISVAC